MTVSPTGDAETDEVEAEETQESVRSDDDGEKAESPAAEGENEAGSMVDAVSAALDRKTSEEESPTSQEAESGQGEGDEKGSDEKSEEDDEEELGDVTEEELARYHSKTRRRVKHLIEQRDTARSEAEGLKDKAGRFDGLMEYVNTSGLSPQEVNQGFTVMSTLVKARTDPAAAQQALEMLSPLVTELQQTLGTELPEDLANEVRQGYISQARARELSQLRSTSRMHQLGAQQSDERARQQQQAAEHQNVTRVTSEAVSEWERAWQASDPDYAAKQPLVAEAIELALRRRDNPPSTAQEAVDLAKKARESVETRIRTFRPPQKKRLDDPLSTDGAGSRGTTAAEPKSMLEAIDRAIQGSA